MSSPCTLHSDRFAARAVAYLAMAAASVACQAATVLPTSIQKPHDDAPQSKSRPSTDAQAVANWVTATRDSHGLPFLIVDKRQATVTAFDASGRPLGSAAALLGLARGDDSVPGIGERKIADIKPSERTTPAGRFAAELGTNTGGEDILWIDYDAAVSMHRVRVVNPADRRLQRLASPTVDDNRISYGCINVPAAFYDGVVKPLFGPRNGIVYVLPETKPLAAVFGAGPAGALHR